MKSPAAVFVWNENSQVVKSLRHMMMITHYRQKMYDVKRVLMIRVVIVSVTHVTDMVDGLESKKIHLE